jgi:ATP-dependent Clp protease ATP-binding subunit ClpB
VTGNQAPAWVREVDFSLVLQPQIMLTGNVRDWYRMPVPPQPGLTTAPTGSADAELDQPTADVEWDYVPIGSILWQVCQRRGYAALATLDPITGALSVRSDGEAPAALRPFTSGPLAVDQIAGLLQAVVSQQGVPIGLMFPYTGRLFPAAGLPEPQLLELMGRIEALGHIAQPTPLPEPDSGSEPEAEQEAFSPLTPFNTVFWLCERQEDLHSAFPLNSRALRVVRVPVPTLDARRAAADFAMRRQQEDGQPADGGAADAAANALAEVTHGMTVREVFACGDVALERGLPTDQYAEAARLLRVGVTDDPWAADALRQKIRNAEDYLNQRVLGQQRAVAKTMDVLYRSAVGLNGAHLSSSPNRPRGVLFLAGPTGVGKTELAKGIASLVLGGDAQPLRFDMSEFRADEAHQRLIGAPPGYVGYDAGGELTNAVRANPVCILLFDEIEKAHPRIFDLFLQILEDGRLTDGRGATVYFTECFLIFTSNLGMAERDEKTDAARRTLVNPAMDARQVEKILRDAYEEFFNRGIGRPELRNRFGDNYVNLDFIRRPTVARIVDKALNTVAARLAATHNATLEIDDEVRESLIEHASHKIEDGGRGINNVIEAALVNPLARHLFHAPVPAGGTIRLTGVEFDDTAGWQLDVK